MDTKRKNSVDNFKKPGKNADGWTQEEILEVAKKILRKMGIPEESLNSNYVER